LLEVWKKAQCTISTGLDAVSTKGTKATIEIDLGITTATTLNDPLLTTRYAVITTSALFQKDLFGLCPRGPDGSVLSVQVAPE
jgi:hypothetical protein